MARWILQQYWCDNNTEDTFKQSKKEENKPSASEYGKFDRGIAKNNYFEDFTQELWKMVNLSPEINMGNIFAENKYCIIYHQTY